MNSRILFYGSLLLLLAVCGTYATAMPGSSHRGPLPEPSPELRALEVALRVHVEALSDVIGERRIGHGDSLDRAREYIGSVVAPLARPGRSRVEIEDLGRDGSNAKNVIFEISGESPEIVLVGAHYDSAPGTPGANDNASGVAATLELLRRSSERRFAKTVRFVLFANEEPPYFQNPGMGSLLHARGCRERDERIDAMLALESLGSYSAAPGSQRYPWPIGLLYPERGDFIAFVGNLGSRSLVRRAIGLFRESTPFPSEGAALPATIPGVGWSDHWAFWQFDYPAIMVTDTATYRDPNYHEASDVSSNVDFTGLARVTDGLDRVITALAGEERRGEFR
jgi:hypothetical protein